MFTVLGNSIIVKHSTIPTVAISSVLLSRHLTTCSIVQLIMYDIQQTVCSTRLKLYMVLGPSIHSHIFPTYLHLSKRNDYLWFVWDRQICVSILPTSLCCLSSHSLCCLSPQLVLPVFTLDGSSKHYTVMSAINFSSVLTLIISL